MEYNKIDLTYPNIIFR